LVIRIGDEKFVVVAPGKLVKVGIIAVIFVK